MSAKDQNFVAINPSILCHVLFSDAMYRLGGAFPIWALVLIAGSLVALVVYFTSCSDHPPVYHWVSREYVQVSETDIFSLAESSH